MQQSVVHLEKKDASDLREYAYDDMILYDIDLNNAVRTTFEKAQ